MADNLRLLKNIFSELEKPLFLGDGLSSGEFHVLMQPGQFMSTNLKEADSSDDMAIQADLTDLLIDTQFIYTTLNGAVSQQYKDILNNAALPYAPLSSDDQAELDKDNQWLVDHKSTYDAFEGYYHDALDAYNQEANSPNPDSSKLSTLQQKVDDTYSDWETMGQKGQYEATKARVIYLISGDPSTMWADFKKYTSLS